MKDALRFSEDLARNQVTVSLDPDWIAATVDDLLRRASEAIEAGGARKIRDELRRTGWLTDMDVDATPPDDSPSLTVNLGGRSVRWEIDADAATLIVQTFVQTRGPGQEVDPVAKLWREPLGGVEVDTRW